MISVHTGCGLNDQKASRARVLSCDDLPLLLDLMCDATDRWEEIATYLPNMRKGSIAVVRALPADADKKLFEIMKRWLDQASPAPTVKDLTDTLRRSFLKENRIARDIENAFLPESPSKWASKHQDSESESTLN